MQVATPLIMDESNGNEVVQSQEQAFSYDDLFPALPQNNTSFLKNQPTPANMRVGSSVVTQVLHVPGEERKLTDSEKFGEGESKRLCQVITKETGASIEISSGKNQSLSFLMIGKLSEVLDARRKILMHFQTQGSKTIMIPKEHHGLILGKKGERLRDLERTTATKINVPNINEDSDNITISGTKEGIEKAEHEIRAMSQELLKRSFERISIPKIYHPFIVGPGNERLVKLCEETGAKINVPPQNVQKDEIVISGEKDCVLAAKARIEEIYKDMEKNCGTVSVNVAKAQHRYIIGPKGSTIQEIFQLTGVSVEMPPSDSPLETITLRGPLKVLGPALTVVYEKANSVKCVEIDAPNWVHRYVIGKRGANMKELEVEYPNVTVNCLDNKIKLEGDPERVEKASAYLESIIKYHLENYTYVVMTVNPSYYKHIIGKGGANLNRLKDELKVNINFEEQEGRNNIRLEGPKEGVAQAQQELKEKIEKLENEKSKDVIIDRRLHRSIIGSKGEKIREIKDRYSHVTIVIPLSSENTDIVKLRGPKEDVDKCHKDLLKLVKEIEESSHTVELTIFKQFHKFIIGKGGANIKKIRDETQTKIDLPDEGDTNEVIVITGKKENVLEAKERIQKIQNELSDIVTEEVQISPKYYNLIIGAGGKLISAIMEECGGVSIKFPTSDSKSDKVTIRGPKDDVEKAKIQLLELANERQSTSFIAEVRAKHQHHKFLIGRNGASIRKIREATKARIIFPGNDDEDKEVITIIGKKENVLAAQEQLEAIIADIDKVTDGEIDVDPKYHKHFVAKRGEILNRISEECGGVTISFPRAGVETSRVTLKGAKDCIEAAKQRIQEIVSDLEAHVTIEVVIPKRLHRTIMGARGTKVQNVTSEYNVQIKFPDRDISEMTENACNGDDDVVRQCDVIKITGRSENCEAAKQALISLIPITEEITVPFDLHRLIIGQKGSNVRGLMSRYDVHIELAQPDSHLDVIKITGTPANVADAKEALLAKVEELQSERKDRELRSFELKMEVDPMYHPKIIGRKGKVINKLRTDFDVHVSLPRKDEGQNIITIIGYEDKAIAARDAILEMIHEYDTLCKEVIEIDQRVHSHIIGYRGRNIRAILDDYKVEILFPTASDTNKDAVTIIGKQENVENAKEHLLLQADEYISNFVDTLPPSNTGTTAIFGNNTATENGFILKDAPWERRNEKGAPNTQSQEDFPDFGTPTPMSSAWGPKP